MLSSYSYSATNAESNFTDPSTTSMMSETSIFSDDWKRLAQDLFSSNGNSTNIVDAVWDVFLGETKSFVISPNLTATTIWDQAVTRTVGWALIILLKTIFFERRFDRWSGAYRFLNLGSTLVPFAMAAWTICRTLKLEEVTDTRDDKTTSSNAIVILRSLWTCIEDAPAIRNWWLTGLGLVLLRSFVFGTIRSSNAYATISSIPGILAGIFSLACWTFHETRVVAILLGRDGNEQHDDILLVQAMLLRWAGDFVTAWYCYAWFVKGIFGTNRFTSLTCFLLVAAGSKFITTMGIGS